MKAAIPPLSISVFKLCIAACSSFGKGMCVHSKSKSENGAEKMLFAPADMAPKVSP